MILHICVSQLNLRAGLVTLRFEHNDWKKYLSAVVIQAIRKNCLLLLDKTQNCFKNNLNVITNKTPSIKKVFNFKWIRWSTNNIWPIYKFYILTIYLVLPPRDARRTFYQVYKSLHIYTDIGEVGHILRFRFMSRYFSLMYLLL